MERRDFLKLTTGSLASLVLFNQFLDVAHSKTLTNSIYQLPKSETPRMAWTVDDGCSSESVRRYTELAIEKDLRFTFFVYAAMSPWTTNAKLLKPLVESGQIQLGNHTLHHPDLTKLSYAQVQKELKGCHNFMEKTYGIDARPYFRAPYGAIDSKVREAAADLGYTNHVAWSGSLADAGKTKASRLLYHADIAMRDQGILIAHANNLTSSENFDQLLTIVNDRNLSLVTLNDVFAPS
jgi:peptidoglycan/xylan/chitin deacetylase (PgdA/CDA1 family)